MTLPQPMPFFSAAANFAAGNDTPREFLERCLLHVEKFEPAVGAFVCHDIAAARAAADRSAARWRDGRPLSPIDGMPLGIKDIIETADMPTEQGSPLFVGCRTGRDAASVAALREAGAVILGKVVTTEFAATEPRGTRNPWDRERTPGGSSSGSAAAVACGMVPAALGTQVVGSILRPASFCGCVGFKPSVGRINRGGSYDYFSQSCTGVLAASLEDALARRGQHSGAGRRRSGISRIARSVRTAPGAATSRTGGAADFRMGRGGARGTHRLPGGDDAPFRSRHRARRPSCRLRRRRG
jgi:Asp-tRNA(Asn)/Glu-tRNA(Gln) amidotransferase A subunit family amidase